MNPPETYRLHLACLHTISGDHCTQCNRTVRPDEVHTEHSQYGWVHTVCGRIVDQRDRRPYCEGPDCNTFVNPADMWANDPLVERPFPRR